VFEWADEPVAVNPHGRLAGQAARRRARLAVEDWG
jgi:phosphoserine phosphatase